MGIDEIHSNGLNKWTIGGDVKMGKCIVQVIQGIFVVTECLKKMLNISVHLIRETERDGAEWEREECAKLLCRCPASDEET